PRWAASVIASRAGIRARSRRPCDAERDRAPAGGVDTSGLGAPDAEPVLAAENSSATAAPIAVRWREIDISGVCTAATWWHPGATASSSGGVLVFDQARANLVRIARDGRIEREFPTPTLAVHDIARDPGPEAYVW